MEENKQILELLKQIEKTNRQQLRSSRLQCILMVITALCCVAVLVMVVNFLPQINAVVSQMETVLGNLEVTTAQLVQMDLESLESVVTNVDALVATGQESLEQTMEKLNALDFETLNRAIQDLAAVVEPLAKFFSAFNRG